MNHPNHKHRTFIGTSDKSEDFDALDLIDCVSLSVEEISAIIFLMQSQYLGHSDKMSDAHNHSTLEVIRKELLDIKTVVNWYLKSKVGAK